MLKTRLAKTLNKGGTIGIVAPASPMRDETKLEAGVRYLEGLGYRVKLGNAVYKRESYLAGSDEQRRADIEGMFADPSVDAIFCARGGYGSMRFVEKLDYSVIRKNPKIFVGFSDLTVLNAAIFRHTGLITFSGAMVGVDMGNFDPESEEQFWRMLSSASKVGTIAQSSERECVRKGTAEGRLVCGNLSMLAAIHGTSIQPEYRDSIILCEDIGEESYKVDRLLCQLKLGGALNLASGLVFGQFTQDTTRSSSTPTRAIPDVLRDYADRSEKPAMGNFMYGHTAKKLTLPYGAVCRMNATRGSFAIEQAVLERAS